jgi:hypothetical protein
LGRDQHWVKGKVLAHPGVVRARLSMEGQAEFATTSGRSSLSLGILEYGHSLKGAWEDRSGHLELVIEDWPCGLQWVELRKGPGRLLQAGGVQLLAPRRWEKSL